MAAPVVPMKLARTAPTARKRVLVRGWAGTSPAMRMPPLMVYRLKSKTMKGPYSPKTARSSTSPARAKFGPRTAGSTTCGAGHSDSNGKVPTEEVIGQRHRRPRPRRKRCALFPTTPQSPAAAEAPRSPARARQTAGSSHRMGRGQDAWRRPAAPVPWPGLLEALRCLLGKAGRRGNKVSSQGQGNRTEQKSVVSRIVPWGVHN